MKVLQYNIFEGCLEAERFHLFKSWMLNHHFDVIGLNEMNGWTSKSLQKEAQKLGFNYSYLFEMEESPYFIGVIAKERIELIEVTEDDPFHHGLIHVVIQGIHFFITHFSPHNSKTRIKEAKEIIRRVESYKDEPVIVMGDFNMLSSVDDHYYKESILHTEREYEPMNLLLEAGLIDTTTSETFQKSFPTSLLKETKGEDHVRIDYILVNSTLNQRNPRGSVIYDDMVEKISDHYPVKCIL